MGLSMATTAMVARRIGEKDAEGAAESAIQAILLGVFVSTTVAIIGIVYAPELLRLMGGDASVVATGTPFARTILGGNIVIFLLFLNNAIFRGAGDATLAMRALWIANIINIVLNPCLIRGLGPFPELGLLGSAVGTTVGRGTGVAFQLWILFGGKSRIKIGWRQFRLRVDVMLRLLRVSVTGMVQMLVSTASWLGMIRIISTFGTAALAGYMLSIRVAILAFLPAWGLCNAAATLVGQNLGAGKPERSEQAVYRAGVFTMIFMGCLAVVFISFAPAIMRIFSNDPLVVRYGTDCLRVISSSYIFCAWGMVTVQAFNGAGDTMTPTLINLGCLWGLQIPLGYFLSTKLELGPVGVFTAIAISQTALAIVGLLAFRTGRWKKSRV
jgi:putative MATE family efflux protein